jgi:hypothetical protein
MRILQPYDGPRLLSDLIATGRNIATAHRDAARLAKRQRKTPISYDAARRFLGGRSHSAATAAQLAAVIGKTEKAYRRSA